MTRQQAWHITKKSGIPWLPLALVFAFACLSTAQPPEPLPLDEEAAPTSDELVVRSPLVSSALDSINAQDPRTPSELLRAVHILQRLGANEDARTFLDQVTSQSLDASQLVEIHQQLGTGTLTQIASDKELAPDAHALVRTIFRAVRQTKRDPARLQGLIAALANDDAEQRRRAIVGLGEAGSHAVPALLEAYRNPPAGIRGTILDAVFVHVGARAEEPLIAALGSPQAVIQRTAARLIGQVGTRRSRLHLIRPFFAGDETLSAAVASSLASLNFRQPTSVASAVRFVADHARRHLQGESPVPIGVDGYAEMWTWSVERNNVVVHRLNAAEASAVGAARLARDAFEIEPSSEHQLLLLVSRLQVDQLLGELDQDLPRGAGTAFELGMQAGASVVADALAWSLKHKLDAAAQGATEILGYLGEVSSVVGIGLRTPLVNALQSPCRRVRYGASRAIMTIDPRQSYPGASHLLETLIELAAAKGRSRALIGTPRQDVAEQLSGMLGDMGLDTRRIGTTRALLREAVAASDFDVLFLSDSVNRTSASEVIQQLRKDPQSSNLPVVLLVRQGQLARAESIATRDDRVFILPELSDETILARTLTAVERSVEHVSVSPQRRLEQAQDAIRWLGHLAEYSRSYAWYDLMRARQVAEEAVAIAALSDSAIDLLGFLGDQASQQLLIENASQESLTVEHRQRAANAFTESVLRRGLMLRRADVLRQYQRYNASETADGQTREILGQVLDVIKTQTKSTATQSR